MRKLKIDPQKNAENFIKAMRMEEVAEVPIWLFFDSSYYPWFAGMTDREYRLNLNKMLKAQIKLRKRFYEIPWVYPILSFGVEASGFGTVTRWQEKTSPSVLPRIKKPEEIESLEAPDPRSDGLFPYYIEVYKFLLDKIPDNPLVFGWIRGPVTVASFVRSITGLFADMYRHPDLAHKLLKMCTETMISWLKVQKEELGHLDYLFFDDDIPGLVSKKFFDEFAFPYNKKIIDSFPGEVWLYHNDSDTTHLLERIADTAISAFSIGSVVNITEAKERIGNRVCILGNTPPLDVLMKGEPETVRESVKEIFDKVDVSKGFVLAPGGVIYRETPPKNVDAMIHSWVKYKLIKR